MHVGGNRPTDEKGAPPVEGVDFKQIKLLAGNVVTAVNGITDNAAAETVSLKKCRHVDAPVPSELTTNDVLRARAARTRKASFKLPVRSRQSAGDLAGRNRAVVPRSRLLQI